MFHVKASHAVADYTVHGLNFADNENGEWADARVMYDWAGYYAIAPKFGCGDFQATPEAAIRSLLMSSGCFAISVVPVHPNAPLP